ncbi:MAG: hypothetical protein SNH79_00310 [Rikenellaceae bacterium]
MYKIEVKSSSDQLWRYNIAATCAGINSAGEQVAFAGKERTTSDQFQSEIVAHDALEKSEMPELILEVELEEKSIEKVHAIIYFITHTLPENRIVEEQAPFAATVTIVRDKEVIYSQEHDVNQWGGATIDITI